MATIGARIAAAFAAAVAAAVVVVAPSHAVNVNACSYSAQAPVTRAVKTLDPSAAVKVQQACRVSVTPPGGAATVVLAGNAFPASQMQERLAIFRSIGTGDEDFTRSVVTRVPGMKDAYLIREVWKDGTGTQLQTVMVKRGAKLLILTNLGLGEHSSEVSKFLRPAQLYALARLVR
jgi:hypothetical protein